MSDLISENYGIAAQYRQASIDYIKQSTHALFIVNTGAIGGIFVLLSSLYNIFTKVSFEWLFASLALFGICLLLACFLNLRNATVFSVLSTRVYKATNTMANMSDSTISGKEDYEFKMQSLNDQIEDMNQAASQELRLDAIYMIVTCILLSFGIGSVANALLLLKFSSNYMYLGILMGIILSIIFSLMYIKLIFSVNILTGVNNKTSPRSKRNCYGLIGGILIALLFIGMFLAKPNSINTKQYCPFWFTESQNSNCSLKNLNN